MSKHEVICPVCSADVPLAGDERIGDEVFCPVCSAPCVLKKSGDGEEYEIEEDC